ncbi:methyltransferase [Streptomyces sp. 2RAF24]|uniref:methyltransferase n=1 Tax=Streptomyces sp. 2RAF24 TaxID=3232997 RepID=UPI003F9E330E
MNEVPNSTATPAAAPPDPLENPVLADNTVPAAPLLAPQSAADTTETAAARAAMVARLEESGVLGRGPVREALLALPREILLPHAYIRVSGPGADLIDWRLLDGSHLDDRQEWLELIHSDESILLQRDGEPLDALPRGPVTGGHMTSMSTYTPATVEALQTMELDSGQRYLELGPGPGVSLALAAAIIGPGLATGVERDGPMAAFAQRNLDHLGVGAVVIEGDGLEGHEARAPYDRIHSGIGVPCVPAPWVEQLAPGGRLLTTLATRTPSWPGQLLVTRTAAGTVEAVLRGRPRGYRPLLGYRWLNAVDHRARIKDDPGTARSTPLAPPPDDAYGFWLAAAYLAPGLVRDFQAETMTIVAPDDDSWAVAGPVDGTVRVRGQRDVWAELEELHVRWEEASRPESYTVDLTAGTGAQTVTSGAGPEALTWTLPTLAAIPRPGS